MRMRKLIISALALGAALVPLSSAMADPPALNFGVGYGIHCRYTTRVGLRIIECVNVAGDYHAVGSTGTAWLGGAADLFYRFPQPQFMIRTVNGTITGFTFFKVRASNPDRIVVTANRNDHGFWMTPLNDGGVN